MRKNVYFFLSILIMLSLSACNLFHDGKVSQDKLPWKKSGEVLLSENFQDSSTHWEEVSNAYEVKRYSEQGYFIYINPENGRAVSTSGKVFSNAKFSVEALKVTGPEDTNYGLVCRYQDKQNFYGFSVGTDGYIGIYKVVEGSMTLISGEKYQYSDIVNQGDEMNTLIASCINDTLTLTLNGIDVMTVHDNAFKLGELGLFLETSDRGEASAIFNHFIVVKP